MDYSKYIIFPSNVLVDGLFILSSLSGGYALRMIIECLCILNTGTQNPLLVRCLVHGLYLGMQRVKWNRNMSKVKRVTTDKSRLIGVD